LSACYGKAKLGEKIAEDGFEAIAGLQAEPILMPYSQ
jgi:hypothetical protein